ncbi:MAG: hypothetical protein V4662_25020 [Verrucomicrobiota bacterium]
MPRSTTRQKDAIERLRGNPITTEEKRDNSEAMREATEIWSKLRHEIAAAVSAANPLLSMEVDELIKLWETHEIGTNINGWVNPYPADDPRSLLTQYQFVSHHDTSPNVCDIQSRQTGKGFTVGQLIGERTFKVPRTRWTITSPSERQSLLTLEKCVDVVEAYGLMIDGMDVERDGSHPQAMVTSKKITLSNKSVVRGVPGLASTLRGDTANLVIDEGDHIENPVDFMRAVFGIVANEMAGEKQVRYITTPLGKNAPSFGYFHDPKKGNRDEDWSCRRINIWQALLMGIKQNAKRLLALYKNDPEGWAQEYLCEWIDSSAVLLTYEYIKACESVEASEYDTPEMLAASPLRKVAGIDFGRTNDPTVMTIGLEALGMSIVRNITKLKGVSTPDQVSTLMPYLVLCDRICVDYTGPGIGFGDLLVAELGLWDPANHLYGKVELCTFSTTFNRILYPAMRLAFEQRNVRVPISTWLREDLHAVQQIINKGQYSYKAPHTDEGHSDGAASLGLMLRAASQGSSVAAFGTSARAPGRLDGGGEGLGGFTRRFLGRLARL